MSAEVQHLPARRHHRVPFVSDIAVQVPDWEALDARVLDLSYGGMSLMLPRALRRGDRLVFGLRLPSGDPRKVEAVVRNVVQAARGQYRVGLEWVVPDEDQVHLRTFVDSIAFAAA